MTLSSVRVQDIVLCDVKGRVFHAIVEERLERELRVKPLEPNITYRHVRAREVKGHWIKSRRRAPAPRVPAQA